MARIRWYLKKDVDFMLDIEEVSYPDPWDQGAMESKLSSRQISACQHYFLTVKNDFLIELGIGFFYVWYVKALDWD